MLGGLRLQPGTAEHACWAWRKDFNHGLPHSSRSHHKSGGSGGAQAPALLQSTRRQQGSGEGERNLVLAKKAEETGADCGAAATPGSQDHPCSRL